MPDLIGYFLTGQKFSEYTNVTTTNLLNVQKRDWDFEIIEKLGIPKKIFTEIDYPGHIRGNLSPEVAVELNTEPIPLIAVGTHDTASAVIPLRKDNMFCSSGTWSLCGIETSTAIINDYMYENNFSNEGTIQGGCRPLRNIMGMWIIQECRRQWGERIPWKDIDREVEKTKPFLSVINPNDEMFFGAGNMVQRIQEYCKKTDQYIPQRIGEISRIIFESLALMYRNVLENMEMMKCSRIKGINITGGGIRNLILNQFTSDCTGVTVETGPIEGAALGNMLSQLIGLKAINNLEEGRKIIENSVEIKIFSCLDSTGWDNQYDKLLWLLK